MPRRRHCASPHDSASGLRKYYANQFHVTAEGMHQRHGKRATLHATAAAAAKSAGKRNVVRHEDGRAGGGDGGALEGVLLRNALVRDARVGERPAQLRHMLLLSLAVVVGVTAVVFGLLLVRMPIHTDGRVEEARCVRVFALAPTSPSVCRHARRGRHPDTHH